MPFLWFQVQATTLRNLGMHSDFNDYLQPISWGCRQRGCSDSSYSKQHQWKLCPNYHDSGSSVPGSFVKSGEAVDGPELFWWLSCSCWTSRRIACCIRSFSRRWWILTCCQSCRHSASKKVHFKLCRTESFSLFWLAAKAGFCALFPTRPAARGLLKVVNWLQAEQSPLQFSDWLQSNKANFYGKTLEKNVSELTEA